MGSRNNTNENAYIGYQKTLEDIIYEYATKEENQSTTTQNKTNNVLSLQEEIMLEQVIRSFKKALIEPTKEDIERQKRDKEREEEWRKYFEKEEAKERTIEEKVKQEYGINPDITDKKIEEIVKTLKDIKDILEHRYQELLEREREKLEQELKQENNNEKISLNEDTIIHELVRRARWKDLNKISNISLKISNIENALKFLDNAKWNIHGAFRAIVNGIVEIERFNENRDYYLKD